MYHTVGRDLGFRVRTLTQWMKKKKERFGRSRRTSCLLDAALVAHLLHRHQPYWATFVRFRGRSWLKSS